MAISHYGNLPKNWILASIEDVCETYTGNSINESEKKEKYVGKINGLPYIGTKDIGIDGIIDYENGVKIPDFSKFKIAPKKSILLCIEGGNAGRKVALTEYDVCFGNKLCCFSPFLLSSEYLFYYLNSDDFLINFRSRINGLIGGVSVNKIKYIPLPIPPLYEQERIVNAVKNLFQILDSIKSNISN